MMGRPAVERNKKKKNLRVEREDEVIFPSTTVFFFFSFLKKRVFWRSLRGDEKHQPYSFSFLQLNLIALSSLMPTPFFLLCLVSEWGKEIIGGGSSGKTKTNERKKKGPSTNERKWPGLRRQVAIILTAESSHKPRRPTAHRSKQKR